LLEKANEDRFYSLEGRFYKVEHDFTRKVCHTSEVWHTFSFSEKNF